jgi:hypothetical protein
MKQIVFQLINKIFNAEIIIIYNPICFTNNTKAKLNTKSSQRASTFQSNTMGFLPWPYMPVKSLNPSTEVLMCPFILPPPMLKKILLNPMEILIIPEEEIRPEKLYKIVLLQLNMVRKLLLLQVDVEQPLLSCILLSKETTS